MRNLFRASITALLMASTAAHAWYVSESEDAMTGKKFVVATVESKNAANFDWPYRGETRARISIRKHPRHGTDVMFIIDRGQIMCRMSNCSILARFDDRKPIKFSASESASNDSTVIFVNNYKNFIEELKKSERVRVSTTIYQEGEQTFEFGVWGFDSSKFR